MSQVRLQNIRKSYGRHVALKDIAQGAGLNWDAVGAALKREGRLHLETY